MKEDNEPKRMNESLVAELMEAFADQQGNEPTDLLLDPRTERSIAQMIDELGLAEEVVTALILRSRTWVSTADEMGGGKPATFFKKDRSS